jgi:GTP pyrophosphokinase
MRTIEHMPREKQLKKARETMDFYVPLARNIGLYRIQKEFEDLSLKYLYPDMYKTISDKVEEIRESSKDTIDSMVESIKDILLVNGINLEKDITFKTKGINEIYNSIKEGKNLSEIHDLLELTLVVDSIPNCYNSLDYIYSLFEPTNITKDFIVFPKTNMYQSYHTTVKVNGYMVQLKIRTPEMDKVASLGLAAFWQDENINMEDKSRKLSFWTNLQKSMSSHIDVLSGLKEALFKKIYIKNTDGNYIEIPMGSTVESFIRNLSPEIIKGIKGIIVNGGLVNSNYILKQEDVIDLIMDNPLMNTPKVISRKV